IDPGAGAGGAPGEPPILRHQVPTVMAVFGAGFAAVFALFALMHVHAYRRRTELQLNELELFDTRTQIQDSTLNVLIGLLSIVIAYSLDPRAAGLAGFAYWLIAPAQFLNGFLMGRKRKRLEQRLRLRAEEASLTAAAAPGD
ncbi:MAG TPA: hypothetical protein VF754_05655, partial [Pyrinomonadaceae bacterium]